MKTPNNKFRISSSTQYYLSTIILFTFITGLYFIQNIIGYQTVSLILLLVLFLLPLFNFERGPIILAAIIGALAWDYYFIPPHFTMHIAEAEDVVMLFMFFIVALTNGVLTSQLKSQKDKWRKKEYRAGALYKLVKSLSAETTIEKMCEVIIQQISKTFACKSVIYFPEDQNKLKREPQPGSNYEPDEMEWLAAEVAFMEKKEAGRYTDIMNVVSAIYFPIVSNNTALCVIGVSIDYELKGRDEELKFLYDFIAEAALFIKRKVPVEQE